MALTATATVQSRAEIMGTLRIHDCKQFVMSFNRPNLNYIVKPKIGKDEDILKDIAEFINSKHRGQAGIVYYQGRDKCEKLAATLAEVHGISAQPFHAQLSTRFKKQVQADWQSGKVKVIFATVSLHLEGRQPGSDERLVQDRIRHGNRQRKWYDLTNVHN